MLKNDDSVFDKTTLHHSEKFQGILGIYLIYLINLTSVKGCQGFPFRSGQ